VRRAVGLYVSGLSAAAVAERLGCSKSALQRLLRERGVSRSRPKLSEWQVDQAVRLYQSGMLLREIGAKFGVSRDCVRLALMRRGFARRPGLGGREC
jgi:transposase